MSLPSIGSVTVCGAGAMGAGIAQVAASSGYRTLLYDLEPARAENAMREVERNLDRMVTKGRLSPAEKEKAISRLSCRAELDSCKADLFIEAIAEEEAAKVALFSRLMKLFPEAIFATNTSSLSVTKMAAATPYPARMGGMHFFNPAPLMPLVEIVAGASTAPAVLETLTAVAGIMNKVPVQVKDVPGFIVNRVARPFYLESFHIAEDGIADFETVDQLLVASGFKMGPFALSDLIGQDINLAVSRSLYNAFHDPRFRPVRLQEEKVNAGHLGRKSGRGFYEYPPGK